MANHQGFRVPEDDQLNRREQVRKGAFRALQERFRPRFQRLAQNVRTSGLRTSGVSQLPTREISRQRSFAEETVAGRFASQEIGQEFESEEAAKTRQGAIERIREQARLRAELEERLSRERTRQALIGGVSGLVGGALLRRFSTP